MVRNNKCFMCKRYTDKKCNKLGYKVPKYHVCDMCPFFDCRTLWKQDTREEIVEEFTSSSFGYSMLEAELECMDEYETY